jgi:hypothetical protein
MRCYAGTVLAVVLVALAGCRASKDESPAPEAPEASVSKPVSDQPETLPRVLGLEEGWELAPKATYTASQTPSEVIIKAAGEHPTAGYETKLVMSPLRIYPPQWMLAMKKPDGPAAQVVTPFEVTASFKANEPVKAVHVSDGAGKHEVPVDQARD